MILRKKYEKHGIKNIRLWVLRKKFYFIQNIKNGIAKSELLKGFKVEIKRIF